MKAKGGEFYDRQQQAPQLAYDRKARQALLWTAISILQASPERVNGAVERTKRESHPSEKGTPPCG